MVKYLTKSRGNALLYIALFFINAAWLCIFLQMTPLMDDWGYVTTPLGGALNLARPADELIGIILKTFPVLFPWFNRLLLLVMHYVNSVIFYKFAVNVLKSKQYTVIFTLLFSVSPWVYAAIAQTDSINQLLMFTTGIIGTYLYFKTNNETRANIYYIIFTALSLSAKESGVAFLAITPAIILVEVIHGEFGFKAAVRRMLRSYLFGFALFAAYFVVFFVVRSYVPLVVGYKYWKTFISKIMFPAAFTGINTFDVYNGFLLNAASQLVLSVPLVFCAFANFVKLANSKCRLALIALVLFIFGELFLLPLQLFYVVTDMHMYPFAFFAMLIMLYFLPEGRKHLISILLAMYFASFMISNAEKVYWQNVSSSYVREFQTEASKLIGKNPIGIYTIFPYYRIVDRGIFYQCIADDWFTANIGGKSLHSVYGYNIRILSSTYYSIDEIDGLIEYAPDDYTVLVVYPDKSMKSIK